MGRTPDALSISSVHARDVATIEINGTTIHYECSGQGPPILFVHGAFGDSDVWADQAARLNAGHTCVRYDRRGYSRSARGEAPVDYALHADDAVALIDALDLAPCLIVGSSSGAVIAFDVALRHGRLLRGAVLSEPPLFGLDPDSGAAAKAELGPAIGAAIMAGGPRAAVDAFMQITCPGLWGIIDHMRKQRYRANADIGFTDVGAPPLTVTVDQLAGVTVPVLLIAGSTSSSWLLTITRTLAAGLPDARLVELDHCGHVTYAEQPAEFADAVSRFVAELDRRPARV